MLQLCYPFLLKMAYVIIGSVCVTRNPPLVTLQSSFIKCALFGKIMTLCNLCVFVFEVQDTSDEKIKANGVGLCFKEHLFGLTISVEFLISVPFISIFNVPIKFKFCVAHAYFVTRLFPQEEILIMGV